MTQTNKARKTSFYPQINFIDYLPINKTFDLRKPYIKELWKNRFATLNAETQRKGNHFFINQWLIKDYLLILRVNKRL